MTTITSGAPAVSIVVPCYGRRDMLLDCLQSLITQGFGDWETIVVDDGTPTGEVREVVEELRDDRVRYVRQPQNLGPGAARNTGFRIARADIILPMDSDDTLDPSFLTVTMSALAADADTDGVFTDFQLFGASEGERLLRVRSLRDLLVANWIPGAGTLQRKSVWERVGGYCERRDLTAEDWDYWIGACEQGITLEHIPASLYRYREHGDSATAGRWSSEYQLRKVIYARHERTFDHEGLGAAFRATGYFASSAGYLRAGRRAKSARLALHAVRLEPRNRRYRRHLATTLIPASLVTKRRERRRQASRSEVPAR